MDSPYYDEDSHERDSQDSHLHYSSSENSDMRHEFSPDPFKERRESSFIPAELARSQIKKIEGEMKKMHKKHCSLLKDMDENYATIERETHQRYIEFINKWKDQLKQKIEQYRKVIENLNLELTEAREYAESTINALQDKVNKLLQEKKDLLVQYDRDITEKEVMKEKAISSMQSAYEKQIDVMQKERLEISQALEEINAEKLNAERYGQRLLEQYNHVLEEKESQESEIVRLVLENTVLRVNDSPSILQVNEEPQKNSLKKEYDELRRKRAMVKQKITQWIKDFEDTHHRVCEDSDKEPIKPLYLKFKSYTKNLNILSQKMQESKPKRARSSSPALNVSVDSTPRAPRGLRKPDRLALLEKENHELKQELMRRPTNIADSIIASSELQRLKTEKDHYKQQVTELQKSLKNDASLAFQHMVEEVEQDRDHWKNKVQELEKMFQDDERYDSILLKLSEQSVDPTTLKTHFEQFVSSFSKKPTEDLRKELDSQIQSRQALEAELENIQSIYAKDQKLMDEMREEEKNLQLRVQMITKEHLETKQSLAVKEQELKDAIRQRKALHNQLEDMRGKIRVFCRVRPMNDKEYMKHCTNILSISDEFTVNCETKPGAIKAFSYDSVLSPGASQEEVFEDSRRLVQSAVDGFNVCIFAYGQTGSGKTYTIQGTPGNPGVAERAIFEIFNVLQQLSGAYSYSVSCYMVENYMYQLIDLFRSNQKNAPKLNIKCDAKGMVYIPEAILKTAEDPEELKRHYYEGINKRQTYRTKMNDSSSRSHLVFSILIEVCNNETGERTVGKLSLVDLAGSERVKKSEATAERLQEGKAINKSLAALGNVINALSSGEAHIPYRDSILTRLMNDSLGGSAKTLMFVNVSPASMNRDETTMSLYYASRVKLITNEPVKNTESRDMAIMKQEINALAMERDKYKQQLEKYGII